MKITLLQEQTEDQVFNLDKSNATIGRTTDNTIKLNDNGCSRHHCVIEYKESQYWITDLRSFNGTKVNGEKVDSKALKNGDKIQLGKCILTVEGITPAISGKKTGAKRVGRRGMKKVTPQHIAMAVVIVIILWIASAIHTEYTLQSDYKVRYKEALAVERSGNAKKALLLVRELEEETKGTPLGKKFKKAADAMEGKIVARKKIKDILTKLTYDYNEKKYSPADYIEELKNFQNHFPELGLDNVINAEIERAKEDAKDLVAQVFSFTDKTATKLLKEGKYADAIEYYQRFADKHETPWKDKALAKVEEVYNALEKEWQERETRLRKFKRENRLMEAFQLARSSYERYQGTPWAKQVYQWSEVLREASIQMRQKTRSRKTTKAFKVFMEQEGIQTLFKKSRWQQALKKFKKYLKREKSEETKKTIKGYIRDLKGILALESKFFKVVNSGKTTIPIAFGKTVGKITKVENRSLSVQLKGQSGGMVNKWENIPTEIRLKLLRNLRFSSKQLMGMAAFCMALSKKREAEKTLVKLYKNKSSAKPAIDEFWSRWNETARPEPGGFIIYKKRILHPQQKVLVDCEEQIKKTFSKYLSSKENTLDNDLDEVFAQFPKLSDDLRFQLSEVINKRLYQLRQRLVAQIKNHLNYSSLKYLKQLKKELEKRRKHALELIFDTKAYPYPNPQKQSQKEVDERVAAVREIWETPGKGLTSISSKYRKWNTKLREIDRVIENKFPEVLEKMDKEVYDMGNIVGNQLNIQNFAEFSSERKLLQNNRRILAENAQKTSMATDQERKQVEITNKYRAMMGMRCLQIQENLTQAARWHSSYMQSSGQFAHNIRGHPHGVTPMNRARKASYPGRGVGENIYMGQGNPAAAHDAWIHSSGHHRNILTASWRHLGVGQAGKYWTQNFGR